MECGCCGKVVVTQAEGVWSCWYCDKDNRSSWHCRCSLFLGGIPQELIAHVFSWLYLPAAVCALTTNKTAFASFSSCLLDTTLAEPHKWSRLKRNIDEFTEDEKLDPVNDILVAKIAQLCPSLTTLDLQACHLVTDEGLDVVSDCCRNLQDVNLRSCTSVTDKAIKRLVKRCALRRINLRGCFRLTDAAIECLALHCPCLSKLDLFYCHEITDRALSALAHEKPDCSCLFEETRQQHHLLSLDLGHCDEITTQGIRDVFLKHLYLESVSLTQCEQLTDAAILPLTGCLQLTYLNLSGCPLLSYGAITEVCSACVLLERLDLGGCIELVDDCLICIAPRLKWLQSISVAECPKLTDAAVIALAQCKNLHTLYATACEHFTDSAILELTAHNPILRTLSVNFCPKLTDKSLLALLTCHKTLQNLHVGQTQISDAGVMPLVSMCKQMKEVDVHNCRVSDFSVVAIGASCPNLENLDVRGCDITDMSLKALMGCNRLQNLYVTGCFRLTYDAFRPLVAKLGDEFQIHAHMSTQF